MAPEMKEHQPQNESLDLWSLGILLYELLTGDIPKENLTFPEYLSKPAENLIRRILMEDPKNRINI